MPEPRIVSILLVEDGNADAFLVEQMLALVDELAVTVERVARLEEAQARLAEGGIDLVLLDLSLPDSQGLDTFVDLNTCYPGVPTVILSASKEKSLALQAVRQGAQDYLVKGEVTVELLARSLQYALERHRLMAELRELSLVDDLTGVYNRRGFMTLTTGHLELARRAKRKFLLVYGDVDGLKQINDAYGHQAGDEALMAAATILRASFRRSDVVARLGGDEFVVLAVEAASDSEATLLGRITERFAAFNAEAALPYRLNFTVGIASIEPDSTETLQAIMAEADRALYARKRAR